MQRQITRGAAADAGLIFHVFAQDSASTTGAGKASIAFGSWTCYYIRSGEAISGAITPQDITTIGTYAAPTANTNIRIKAVDNTNMIGMYEIQIHADWVNTTNTCQSITIYLTATGVAVLPIQIPLIGPNMQDSVRAGLTALPNAAASGVGGLLTAPTTANVGLADLSRILGTALTETAGQIAAGFKQFFNITSPTSTMNTITAVTTTTTATNVTTVNGLAAGVITAASINAAALNGKGDWNIGKTGYELSATGSVALTEAYAADGVAPTLNQMLYQIWSALGQYDVVSTTLTTYKLNGTTPAMTFTLNDATNPTSRTRAT